MNEQEFLSLTGPRQRVYYRTVKVAVEYFDSMGNTVRLDGQLPEGRVKDLVVSAECDKTFMSGRLHGELRLVNALTGKPLLVEFYRNGVLDGLRTEYFEDGLVKTEQFFRNGKLDGPSKEYYDSGGLRIEDTYKDGLLLSRKEFRETAMLPGPAGGPGVDPQLTARFIVQAKERDFAPAPEQAHPADSVSAADLQDFEAFVAASAEPVQPVSAPPVPAPAQAAPPQPAAGPVEIVRKSTDDIRCYCVGDREVAREKLNKLGQPVDMGGLVPDGIVREYYKNNQLKFEEQWRGGKINGYRKKFDELGRIWAEESYRNDKLEGIVKIHNYFKDKVFEEEANFSEGQLHGSRKTYYPNGVLSVEEHYQRGKLDGPRKSYYEGGLVNTDENYKDDRLHGLRKRFYDTGKLWIEENYAEGKLEGSRRDYYPSGKLRFEEQYKNSQLHGKRIFYYDNGLPMFEEDYMYGRLTLRQEFKENRFRQVQ